MGEHLPFNITFKTDDLLNDCACAISSAISSCNEVKQEQAPVVPKETKTIVEDDGNAYTVKKYTDGRYVGFRKIMPSIKFIELLGEQDDNPRCVKVYFTDGTSERAVTSANDTFNVEQGISICITKKLLSMVCGGCGNTVYNKIVKHGMDVLAAEFAHLEAEKAEAEANAERAKRRAEKKKRKAERRAELERQKKEAEREEYIKTQVEIEVRVAEELIKKYGCIPAQSDDTTETTV